MSSPLDIDIEILPILVIYSMPHTVAGFVVFFFVHVAYIRNRYKCSSLSVKNFWNFPLYGIFFSLCSKLLLRCLKSLCPLRPYSPLPRLPRSWTLSQHPYSTYKLRVSIALSSRCSRVSWVISPSTNRRWRRRVPGREGTAHQLLS